MAKEAVQPTFSQKLEFWVDLGVHFGSILGSKIALKMVHFQNKEDFGPPGVPRVLPGVIFGRFWEALGGLWSLF